MTSVPSPSSATPEARTVNLAEVLLDRGTQSRLGGNDSNTVKRYAQDMALGLWDFSRPPLPLLFFDGDCYYPGDGHHRIAAARQVNRAELLCEVRSGDQREALFYSNTEANRFHGKQLTRRDKRNRVRNLLMDGEWALMSDREIARHCGVSAPFVGHIRREMIEENQIADSSKRKGRDGKVRDTSNIGKVSSGLASAAQAAEAHLAAAHAATPAPTPSPTPSAAPSAAPSPAVHVVEATLYEALLQERDSLQNRLADQRRHHALELAQITEASQADDLRQALADDEALMQQLYDGLGTIAAALQPDASGEQWQRNVMQAAQGIALMRRILEAKAPNLRVDAAEAEDCGEFGEEDDWDD